MKISLCLLATRRYKRFVQNLLDDVKKYFLLAHEIQVHLFIDEIGQYEGDARVGVYQELIPSYAFPQITLYRYAIMTQKKYDSDYIFYFDVDMAIMAEVTDSFLGNIVAVRHPGFDKAGGGSWETNKESTSYTYPENRKSYYAGGVQGGATEYYYRIMQGLKRDIEEDERNGIVPVWHDESAWNRYLSECKSFTEHDSRYCMVEEETLQKKWGIDGLPKIIIALAKNHNEIRS